MPARSLVKGSWRRSRRQLSPEPGANYAEPTRPGKDEITVVASPSPAQRASMVSTSIPAAPETESLAVTPAPDTGELISGSGRAAGTALAMVAPGAGLPRQQWRLADGPDKQLPADQRG